MKLKNLLTLSMIIAASSSAYANLQVTNGHEVPNGKYPWYGTLSVEKQPDTLVACGAALIAPDWVITAAHCVTSYYPDLGYNAKVVFGLYDKEHPYKIEKRVAKKIISYWGKGSADMSHDIALIKLDNPVEDITPVKLATQEEKPMSGSYITVMGFGIYKVNADGKAEYPSRMQEASVPVQPSSVCDDPHYHISEFNSKTDICEGTITGKRINAALGDSGSPAVQLINGEYVVVGVTSHGAPFDFGWKVPLPAVYTFTGAFSDWVQQQMKGNK